jgi:MerR family transcriptional regulator, redox-sensitive transcriptional activator SoxR
MSQQDTTQTMTIGELSRITGLSTSALRFYQRRGVLPARDEDAGWQRFESVTLDRLALIELAKGAGFTLDEVIRILDALDADPDTVPAQRPIWQGLAEVKVREIDTLLARLTHLRDVLQGSLDLGYLPADRARRLPGVLGWTAPHVDEPADVRAAGPTA